MDTIISNTASTIDNAPYIFEITNMDDTQLKSFMDKLSGKTPENKDQKDDNNNNNNDDKNNKPAQNDNQQAEPASN